MEINRNLQFAYKQPSTSVIDAPLQSGIVNNVAKGAAIQGEKVTLSTAAVRLSQKEQDGVMTPMTGGGTELPPWPPEDET